MRESLKGKCRQSKRKGKEGIPAKRGQRILVLNEKKKKKRAKIGNDFFFLKKKTLIFKNWLKNRQISREAHGHRSF